MRTSRITISGELACKLQLILFPTLMQLLLIQFAPVRVAADADPLQDFCVADLTKDLYVNGYPCKNPDSVSTDDFVFHGFQVPPSITNFTGANAVGGFVAQYPGLNSLGISMARLDFGKGGIITPHAHPRASELIYVLQGSLYAGFVTTSDQLFAKVIHKGDVMIFPRGLLHFQLNVGDGPAQAIVSLNSQNPGFQLAANAMFGSNIKDEVLEKAFQLDQKTVDRLKAVFSQIHV